MIVQTRTFKSKLRTSWNIFLALQSTNCRTDTRSKLI
uniref:Uncharacterized protein n=1 Tax=Anopheles christyi TaxID=43041 RepID=A0A182KI33_9DIPT